MYYYGKRRKGYWFSTENGTHVHAEEGESKVEAMGKKFSNFGKKETKDNKNEAFDNINAKRTGINTNKGKKALEKLHQTFKETAQEHSKNYNETDKKVIDMIKQGKTKWEKRN